MSENLTKLAHKIDFFKDESKDKGKATSEAEREEEKAPATFVTPHWPWESIRDKLRLILSLKNMYILLK